MGIHNDIIPNRMLRLNQREKAIQHYRRSLELNPDNEAVKKAISKLNSE